MINDCINLVFDGIPSTGGCRKCFMSCPYYIRDNMDMACGGACYEPPVDESEEEEINKESESDSSEDNQK